MTQKEYYHVSLSPYRAFVVQFYHDANVPTLPCTGRVEHVTSGQAARFQSLDALLTFMDRVLHEVDASYPEGR